MVERIVACAQPEKIILFGSHARGDARSDSDVDLLVVMPDGVDRRSSVIAMRVAVADMPLPKDILVTTPADIASRGQLRSTVLYAALNEGKVVYVR